MSTATILGGPMGGGFAGRVEQGGFSPMIFEGRAKFPTTATSCTISNFGSGLAKVRNVFVQAMTSGVVLTYCTVDSAGIVTVNRSDTTSAGEFSFQIKYG